ncbi:MAG: hypothetical protein MPF33_07155 [Candidatus Aramenus sp.]|jgi:hypothetical protein|nr:hypothetical protein [Candidatus Aramenus sp.]
MFEIFVDMIVNSEEKVITDDGHLVAFSKGMAEELRNLGIGSKAFANWVTAYFEERVTSYSVYYKRLNVPEGPEVFSRVFEFWVNFPNYQTKLFAVISNFKDVSKVTLIDSKLINMEVEKVMKDVNKYKDALITMPFLYKFLVFEAFNAFRKMKELRFEGLVRAKQSDYLLAVNKDLNAVIWMVDSTNLKYVNDVGKENLGVSSIL